MRRKERRVGPLSRLEPMKKCASVSCLSPQCSAGGSLIHEKYKKDKKENSKKNTAEYDPLLFPDEVSKRKS